MLGVLGKEGGARMMSFDAMVGGLEDGGVLKREEADAMVEWMRERMRAARLWEEEVLALRFVRLVQSRCEKGPVLADADWNVGADCTRGRDMRS